MEFYFGNSNYKKDEYLKSFEGHDKWINLRFINKFRKMKKFCLRKKDVYDMMKLSTVVEVDEKDPFKDGKKIYYIRKRAQEMNEDVAEIFGFNIETVKKLSKEQFEIFIQKKDAFEK